MAHGILGAIVYLVVMGLIWWAIWWFVNWVGIPEPFLKVVKVVLGLFALLVLVDFLLGFTGYSFLHWR